jgi:mono/diheme cytochrome c family protein
MKRMLQTLITAALTVLPFSAFPNTQIEPSEFTAASGEKLWNQTQTVSGQARNCASCHTSDPRKAGKHVRTGKPIKPMAPSVNSDRFADPKKVAKWFKRNCKWTLGRECSMQEKGDFTKYLNSL